MVGQVYRLAIQGAHHDDPHPHVVVVELSGAKESICVPSFSADGQEVQLYLDSVAALGIPMEAAFVELDNARMVTFLSGRHTGKRAYWLVERHRRLSQAILRDAELIGQMKPEGLSMIAQGLLRLSEARPAIFSGPLKKKLRKLASAAADPNQADSSGPD